MLLTNVASWYWDNKEPEPELISYFDLNNNWTEQVTNTDCSSMLASGQEVRWQKDPLDNTRYCACRSTSTAGASGNTHGLYNIMFSDPREYQTSNPSYFKIFIPAYTNTCYDTNKYSELLGKTVEFMYLTSNISTSSYQYILCNLDLAGSNTDGSVMGYDMYQSLKSITIQYRNASHSGTTYTNVSFYNDLQANTWYKFKISYIAVTSSTYRMKVELYNSNDVLLTSYDNSSVTIPCGSNSSNSNNRDIRFFNSAWGWAKQQRNVYGYLKEFKIYPTN